MKLVRGLVFSVLVCGCGSTGGEAIRPREAVAPAATVAVKPAVCHEVGREGTPLVVDWKPEQRGELEAAMKQGVVVVHYDCDGLKVLPACKVPGDYTFTGTSRREQAIQLGSAEEAKANLPASGGQLGAALTGGASIDVGMTVIGKSTTKVKAVEKSDLTGSCEGATHFVSSVFLGAFAMKTGTVSQSDGDPAACKEADPDAQSPPKDCRAPIKIYVEALGAADPDAPDKDLVCEQGLTVVKGKCAVAEANVVRECSPDDKPDCKKQCDAGNVASCFIFANHGAVEVEARIAALQRACDLGDAGGCGAAGQAVLSYRELTLANKTKAVELLRSACNAGNGEACESLGTAYNSVLPVDKTKALRYLRRSCNLGWADGCEKLGNLQGESDVAGAFDAYKMGCTARYFVACDKAADAVEKGRGTPVDLEAAKRFRQRACKIDPAACKANRKSEDEKKGPRKKK